MENIVLEYKNIHLEYKNFTIDNISFSLTEGYIMALVGKNGSGKTTLMNMITNTVSNYTGEVLVNGLNCKTDKKDILSQCAVISEDAPFFFELDAMENASIYKPYYSQWNQEMYTKYLKTFEIPKYTKIGNLSKGTFIKFQLAFAAARMPKLYIMDEPTAGLDPVFRKDFLGYLRELANQNASILISSHLLKDLDQIADYVTLVDNGRLIHSKEHLSNLKGDYHDFTTTN